MEARAEDLARQVDTLALQIGDHVAAARLTSAVDALREVLGPEHEPKLEEVVSAASHLQCASVDAALQLMTFVSEFVKRA